jgi:hypothetical protein
MSAYNISFFVRLVLILFWSKYIEKKYVSYTNCSNDDEKNEVYQTSSKYIAPDKYFKIIPFFLVSCNRAHSSSRFCENRTNCLPVFLTAISPSHRLEETLQCDVPSSYVLLPCTLRF